jgi:signal transduction histidine kinase
MAFLLIGLILLVVFFATTSLVLFLRHQESNLTIAKQEASERQKLYELSILKQVQDKIGYSLDIEYVTEVIIASLKHVFTYSTASSMVIKDNKVMLKTHIEQPVGASFIEQVKKSMLTSLTSFVPNTPIQIEEQVFGPLPQTGDTSEVKSFFNIPLTVGNRTIGLINVSSINKDLYSETEVTVLREIVDQASGALTKLENILVTEQGKLNSTIASLADGVFMVDLSSNLSIINQSARQFLKLTSGSPIYTEIISAFGTTYNIVEKIKQAIETNQQIIDKDININERSFEMFITPVIDQTNGPTNKPIGASVLMHDVTIEKNLAKIKEDFTHMVVHELRAPLTAIKDSSELMLEVFDGKGEMPKEQQAKLLSIIDRQSKNLLEQIGQILDAAKIESGKFTINKIPSDIGQVIQDSVETFASQAQKQQILLTPDVASPLPKVEIDPLRMSQVLNNLISNSLKFTPPSGKITVSAKVENGEMIVSVSDTGAGIAEEEQASLFSKYYQAKSAPGQTSKKGTGLGLFITKGIVEAHGGTIGIISKPGEGTNIYFKLQVNTTAPQVSQEHFPVGAGVPVSNMVN